MVTRCDFGQVIAAGGGGEAPGIKSSVAPREAYPSRSFPQDARRKRVRTATGRCADGRGADDSRTKPAGPRAAMLAHLSADMQTAIEAGGQGRAG